MSDAGARVTGRLGAVADLELPGMLHGALARSVYAHARIVAIDATDALRVGGVRAVLTGADLAALPDPGAAAGGAVGRAPLLAADRVRYVGEPLAAIAAESAAAAAAAARLIEVTYEELRPSLRPAEALAAPPLHEGAAGNVAASHASAHGDAEAALAAAEHVFEEEYAIPALQQGAPEPHVCLAAFDASRRLDLWASTEAPHALVAELAAIFGIPRAAIRVRVPPLGGGFGDRRCAKIEPLAALLALRAGRPVRLLLSREEEFVTALSPAAEVRLLTGVDGEGRIVAARAECAYAVGAYARPGADLLSGAALSFAAAYPVPNLALESRLVFTNLPPADVLAERGAVAIGWAYERQVDIVAARLGLDPLAVRRRNLGPDAAPLLERVAEGIGWAEPDAAPAGARVRAKGLARVVNPPAAPSVSTVSVRVNDDGSVNVLSSAADTGRGLKAALAARVTEVLGVPPGEVDVSDPDTAITPYDLQPSPAFATLRLRRALDDALAALAAGLLELAGRVTGAEPATLRIEAGRIVGAGGVEFSLSEAIRKAKAGNVVAHGRYVAGPDDAAVGGGPGAAVAAAAEVEVDLETGGVTVLDLRAAVAADEVAAGGPAELGAAAGAMLALGRALFEEVELEAGQVRGPNLDQHMIPSLADAPARFELALLEGDGIAAGDLAEATLPVVCPAIGNAVARAIGRRITDLPMTPERLLAAPAGAAPEPDEGRSR